MMPWAAGTGDRELIESTAASIVGEALERVAYLVPATSEQETRRHFGSFDEVDMGVEMRCVSGRRFICVWRMKDLDEGLFFGEVPEGDEMASLKRIEVSDTAEWQRLMNQTITGVGLAWHVPEEGASEAVWAVRLSFERSSAIVLALGESGELPNEVRYMPDNIAVIFAEEMAKAYEPASSLGSSWGSMVAGV